MSLDPSSVAHELTEWFQSVQRLMDAGLFNIAPEGPHRDAIVLDALRRHAKALYNARLDVEGKLYSPLCFFLAAACRYLRASLGIGHWRAALDNLRDLQQRLANYRHESLAVGLDLGTPETLFKGEFDEAIRQAGLVDDTSFLSKDDRQVAIGLAINWGIRFLLAYALETPRPGRPSGSKDLAWLAEQLGSAAPGCAQSLSDTI